MSSKSNNDRLREALFTPSDAEPTPAYVEAIEVASVSTETAEAVSLPTTPNARHPRRSATRAGRPDDELLEELRAAPKERKVALVAHIDPNVDAELRRLAAAAGMSLSSVVNRLLSKATKGRAHVSE